MTDKKTCGAKRRDGGSCQRPPMQNGRCRIHGGLTPSGPDHHAFRTGRYVRYLPESIAQKIEEYKQGNPLDLQEELALLRGLLGHYVEGFQALEDGPNAGHIDAAQKLISDIGSMVDRIVRIQNSTALTAAEVTFLATRIADSVSRYIHEPTQQAAFLADIFGSAASLGTIPTLSEGDPG